MVQRGEYADQTERQQRGSGDGLPVNLRVAQAKRLERFYLDGADDLPVSNDGLSALVGLQDRGDRLASVLLGARRGVLILHLVGAHEALHHLDDDGPIRVGKEG